MDSRGASTVLARFAVVQQAMEDDCRYGEDQNCGASANPCTKVFPEDGEGQWCVDDKECGLSGTENWLLLVGMIVGTDCYDGMIEL
jgi:hypothetical protein